MPPLRFTCSNCGERLSTARTKAGNKVKCPACKHIVLVPITPDAGPPQTAARTGMGPALHAAESPPPPASESGPVELVYADEDKFESSRGAPDAGYVMLRRSIVYVQGFLLGFVAIVFFILGVVVGGRSARHEGRLANPRACIVQGAVSFADSEGDRFPDEGSVICIVPATRRPDQKLAAESLGPDAPRPDELALRTIQQLGGTYARADARGAFRLHVPTTGRYYVLIVSKHALRPSTEHPSPRDLAEMGRYFVPATTMVQQYRYQWQLMAVTQDRKLDVAF